jgi:hypothetical protein
MNDFRNYPTAMEIVTYLPVNDTSGYMLQIESNKLYARNIYFDFSSGLIEDLAEKQMLIADCERIKSADSISYMVCPFIGSYILK